MVCVQAYANAALQSYTTELYKSHLAWVLASANNRSAGGASSSGNGTHTFVPPALETNASYVMCPEAVGALSESLRRFSLRVPDFEASEVRLSDRNVTDVEDTRDRVRSHHSRRASRGARRQSSSSSEDHSVATTSDAHRLASGDLPYMVLLAPSMSMEGLSYASPQWDLAAGSGAKGRQGASSQQQLPSHSTGWVEIGCRVASVRHLPSIDVSV